MTAPSQVPGLTGLGPLIIIIGGLLIATSLIAAPKFTWWWANQCDRRRRQAQVDRLARQHRDPSPRRRVGA